MKKAWVAFFYSPPKRTWIFLLYFALLALVHSWIGEDFLITVRSILNFIHGFGPVYNIGERVQAYTHPLWFFLMSGVIALTKEIFYSAILVSVLFSFLAILLMSKAHGFEKKSSYFATFVLFITFSGAFMDYTSSGLENPLGYLLFSGLVWCFYKNHYFYLPLLAALLFLTRYDYLFMFMPFLVFYLIQSKQWKEKILCFSISGFVVLSWLVFSLYYYGSLFPSTYYAKTVGSSDKMIDILTAAFNYYKATMTRDFLTFLPFIFCFIFIRSRFLDKKDKLVVFSVIPYLLYIFWIGGDFMQGRFSAIPFFLTAPVFIKCVFRSYKTFFVKPLRLIICALLMKMSYSFLFYKSFPIVEFFIGANVYGPHSELGILTIDERAVFFEKPFNFNSLTKQINESYRRWGKPQKSFKSNFFCGYLGISGLIMGRGSHVVDYCGLSDFFLATLKPSSKIFPGHYHRRLPLGYMSTILSKGKINYICDKNIREHWENVKEKTRAPPKITNLWKNLKDSFEIKQKTYAPPDFKQTLVENEDCARDLKNLFIQKIDKKALLRQYYTNGFGLIKHALIAKQPGIADFGKVKKYISDHRIFDLSAQVKFGAAKAQCFKVVLDSFSDFTLSFVKDRRPFEKVYLAPKKRDSYIKLWEVSPNSPYSSWIWSVYKVCLKEKLETDDLVIRLSCDPTIERFCYIHSISEIK